MKKQRAMKTSQAFLEWFLGFRGWVMGNAGDTTNPGKKFSFR